MQNIILIKIEIINNYKKIYILHHGHKNRFIWQMQIVHIFLLNMQSIHCKLTLKCVWLSCKHTVQNVFTLGKKKTSVS